MRDTEIQEAARALDAGDPVRALSLVEGRGDGHALAVRGVALAQLEERTAARQHLRRAMVELARLGDPLHRARAAAALAEIAAGERELSSAIAALADAAAELEALGDRTNAAWMLLTRARLHTLLGERASAELAVARAAENAAQARSPVVRAVLELARAEAHQRSFRARDAAEALARAAHIAADHPILAREIARQSASLSAPTARLLDRGRATVLDAFGLEAVYRSTGPEIVVDALRRTVTSGDAVVDLSRRPVLFELLRALAAVAPEPASAETLIRAAFATRVVNESYRARLRVELGRLRRVLGEEGAISASRGAPSASRGAISASRGGWIWTPERPIVLLLPLDDGPDSVLTTLLGDGAAWTSEALAQVTGRSRRTVQRSLEVLLDAGRIQTLGQGRARRYLAGPTDGRIASQMLLLGLARLR